jgi:nardilysin
MEKGIDLRDQIFKLYRDYYHGGLMKLVVIGGGEPLISLLSLKWLINLERSLPKFC